MYFCYDIKKHWQELSARYLHFFVLRERIDGNINKTIECFLLTTQHIVVVIQSSEECNDFRLYLPLPIRDGFIIQKYVRRAGVIFVTGAACIFAFLVTAPLVRVFLDFFRAGYDLALPATFLLLFIRIGTFLS